MASVSSNYGKCDNAADCADGQGRLADCAKLADTDIVTSLVASLGDDLHTLFDPVSDGALPIYFGPLLGRLYLEGL
jgi:hypothetical protein